MAGGMQAVLQSVEGAEDNEEKGAEAIAHAEVHQNDVVIAVVASGTTPFTIGALRSAGARGAPMHCSGEQPRRTAFRTSAPSYFNRDRHGGALRLNADASGNSTKDRPQSLFYSCNGQARPRLSGSDGKHARKQREASSPGRDHR